MSIFALGALVLLSTFGMQNALYSEDYPSTSIEVENMDNIELLISEDDIKTKIAQVARDLDAEYKGEELTIVMVMKGAVCVTADLIRALKIPCTIEYVSASSYGKLGSNRGDLKISGVEELDLDSKNVLVVDDIYDSGETISGIVAKLKKKNPKSLKSLVLLSKNKMRNSTYVPDYVLFDIDNQFVIGFGLDYKELYRGLPGIYVLN